MVTDGVLCFFYEHMILRTGFHYKNKLKKCFNFHTCLAGFLAAILLLA